MILAAFYPADYNRNKTSFEDWMKMDLQYIDNWSLRLDAKLLAQTIGAVFRCSGQ
jgi:lipopolysaccharide/colanic/teichoic acid biosynthesis glycosyltransferase